MQKTNIYIKAVYQKDGKFGKEYQAYSLEKIYYTSRKPFPDWVQESAEAEIEWEPTKNAKYRSIKSITQINAHPESASGEAAPNVSPKPPVKGEPISQAMTPSIPEASLTEQMQTDWMRKASNAMNIYFGEEAWDPLIYMPMWVEFVRQYHSQWMSKKINAEKQANMDRIARERGRQ